MKKLIDGLHDFRTHVFADKRELFERHFDRPAHKEVRHAI